MVHAEHVSPRRIYVGTLMELCQDKRGTFIDMQYRGQPRKAELSILPLNEIIFDFFDQVKSRSRGYASFDYELKDYRESDLVKLDILLNGDIVRRALHHCPPRTRPMPADAPLRKN